MHTHTARFWPLQMNFRLRWSRFGFLVQMNLLDVRECEMERSERIPMYGNVEQIETDLVFVSHICNQM